MPAPWEQPRPAVTAVWGPPPQPPRPPQPRQPGRPLPAPTAAPPGPLPPRGGAGPPGPYQSRRDRGRTPRCPVPGTAAQGRCVCAAGLRRRPDTRSPATVSATSPARRGRGAGAGPAPPRVVRAGRFKSGGGGGGGGAGGAFGGGWPEARCEPRGERERSGAGPPGAAPRRFVCPARTKAAPRRHPGEHERAKPLGTAIPESQPRLGALPAPPGSSLPREGTWIRVCLGGCGQINP